jgi:hypothetical protein
MKKSFAFLVMILGGIYASAQPRFVVVIDDLTNGGNFTDFSTKIYDHFISPSTRVFTNPQTNKIEAIGTAVMDDRNFYARNAIVALKKNKDEFDWMVETEPLGLFHFKFIIEQNQFSVFKLDKKITLAWRPANENTDFRTVSVTYCPANKMPQLLANAQTQMIHIMKSSNPKSLLHIVEHQHLKTCNRHWISFVDLLQSESLWDRYYVINHKDPNTAVINLANAKRNDDTCFKFRCMIDGNNRGESRNIDCSGGDDVDRLISEYNTLLRTNFNQNH